jgi:anti-sigma-K factor RskA
MDKFSNHIKTSTQHIQAPKDLRDTIMKRVTNQGGARSRYEHIQSSKQALWKVSPFGRYSMIASSCVAAILVIFISMPSSPSTDSILNNISSSYDLESNTLEISKATSSTLEYIDSLQTIQNLAYRDSELTI